MTISNDVILQKLNDLSKSFDEFKDEYSKGRDRHIQEHDRIEKEIYGINGDEGMKTKVTLNTNFRKNTKKGLWIIISAIIGQLVIVGFLLIRMT